MNFEVDVCVRVVQTLAHCLWQVLLIALIVAACNRLAKRRSASARYILGVSAMLSMIVCLGVTFVLLPHREALTLADRDRHDSQSLQPVEAEDLDTELDESSRIGAVPIEEITSAMAAAVPPYRGWGRGEEEVEPRITKVDAEHPLARHLDLSKVKMSSAFSVRSPHFGQTVISSTMGSLLAVGSRTQFRDVVLGFDPQQSNWPAQPSFPIFVTLLLKYAQLGEYSELIISKDLGGRVSPDGFTYSLDGRVVDAEELTAKLKPLAQKYPAMRLIIRAGAETPYGRVAAAMQSARAAGILNVQVATNVDSEPEPKDGEAKAGNAAVRRKAFSPRFQDTRT